RDGYKINLGQWSFIQFLSEKENDTVTLYRGMILSQVPNGSGHFSVITSNARAYFKRGTAIVLYSQKNEETELVTLENSATLENRFQSGRKILAKEGEITVLNFKAKRVVPSLPQAVTLLAAKEKLNEFNINEDDQYSYLQNILKRQKRKFASHLSPKTLNRKIASPEHYLRHPTLSEDESTLIHEMVRKNVAGDTLGEKMLFPEKAAKRAASIRVNIEEVKEGFIGKDEIAERKRLIEELSQIRPDE
ncbi:MAG: hypothetical protein HY843_07520, partial [Bdellovibrio sp.]|nr:hypothetical protein [Bdellovibrio sp.]